MFKGTKLTPIINELQQWENQLTSIELFFQEKEQQRENPDVIRLYPRVDSLFVAIPTHNKALMQSIYAAIVVEVEKLQKELKEKLEENV
jgi:hypothetical protein